jgi:PleD family two-component response regulator
VNGGASLFGTGRQPNAGQKEVAALNQELAIQALTDGLTHLPNRRRFDEVLDQEWRRGAREQRSLSR